MRYHVLASDYDGTLATDGFLPEEIRRVLEELRATGRKIVLVTGRRLDDLQKVCPNLSVFDIVVAENGCLLYWPSTHETKILAEPTGPAFSDALAKRGVTVDRGKVILATWQPNEAAVLDVIQQLGLELQVIFNKGAVMILPSGVNKGTGLKAALELMQFSAHNAVGVGDAENDHALLAACECGVAVGNSVPMLKERSDWVTTGTHGEGVAEVVAALIADDLAKIAPRLSRHDIPIGTVIGSEGTAADSVEVTVPAFGCNVLLAGTSGGGKSTLATAFLEGLDERAYQYLLLDPEGDHGTTASSIVLGTHEVAPAVEELERIITRPTANAVANLLAVGVAERPVFFEGLLPRVEAQRLKAGHPHWFVIDEVHHVAPHNRQPALALGRRPTNWFMITVQPDHVAAALLKVVDALIVIGATPQATVRELADSIGVPMPDLPVETLARGDALIWWPTRGNEVTHFRGRTPRAERRRHIRKYAEGDLSIERSFYFRGPEGKLNLRAQNLMSFLDLADGIDEETWQHHLCDGGYSRWLRDIIKDASLADEVALVEESGTRMSANESRRRIRAAIERRYTRTA